MTYSVSDSFRVRKTYLNILVKLSALVGFDYLNKSWVDNIWQLLHLSFFKRYFLKGLISWSSQNNDPEHLPHLPIEKTSYQLLEKGGYLAIK